MGKVKLMTKLKTNIESVETIIKNIFLRNGLRELVAESVERETKMAKAVKYISSFIGELFNSKVSGMIYNGIFVQLENLVEGFITFVTLNSYYIFSKTEMAARDSHDQISFKIGDPVMVKLVSIDSSLGYLNFITKDDNSHENN